MEKRDAMLQDHFALALEDAAKKNQEFEVKKKQRKEEEKTRRFQEKKKQLEKSIAQVEALKGEEERLIAKEESILRNKKLAHKALVDAMRKKKSWEQRSEEERKSLQKAHDKAKEVRERKEFYQCQLDVLELCVQEKRMQTRKMKRERGAQV